VCRAGAASAVPLSAGFFSELLLRDDLAKPGHMIEVSGHQEEISAETSLEDRVTSYNGRLDQTCILDLTDPSKVIGDSRVRDTSGYR